MLEKIVIKLQSWVDSLEGKYKSTNIYNEALALHTAKKYRNAFPLMKEAAQLGNRDAMAILGSMYLLGNGTFENGSEALKWLQKAVDQGQIDAIGVLGMAYVTGKAKVKIDMDIGCELLTKASKLGDEKSTRMLEMIENGEGMFAKIKNRPSRRG